LGGVISSWGEGGLGGDCGTARGEATRFGDGFPLVNDCSRNRVGDVVVRIGVVGAASPGVGNDFLGAAAGPRFVGDACPGRLTLTFREPLAGEGLAGLAERTLEPDGDVVLMEFDRAKLDVL